MTSFLKTLAASCAAAILFSCTQGSSNSIDSQYFIGTNFWYGPILGSTGPGGDRARLCAELDTLCSIGVTNLRVLVGAEGEEGTLSKIEPVLQVKPGEYDPQLLEGLDYMLGQMATRGMKAVLFLNNAWEWSGGYRVYLEWATGERQPHPAVEGYWPYMCAMAQFAANDAAKELYFNHVRTIVEKFKDSPAIYSWQLCNEPRCFSSDPEMKDAFISYIRESAALIKSIDPVHMVSAGNEGLIGCERDPELLRKLNESGDIDYITAHIWPLNWKWIDEADIEGGLQAAIDSADAYIDLHLALADELGKDLVIEEFGFPRDGFSFDKNVPASTRDKFYTHIFERVAQSKAEGGHLKGVNFWGWGGLASQAGDHVDWRRGDDYCGDPAQEQQGLNSVYASDTATTQIIKQYNIKLSTNQ